MTWQTLFWERGYSATGLNDILSRAEARSGSFYHFFRGKEDLLNAVLDTYVEALEPVVIDPARRAAADGLARVFAVLEGYRRSLVGTNCTYGCPIGRLALEINPANEASLKLIAKNFDAWARAVELLLRQEAGRFPASTDFAQLAQFVLTVMEGGVMQARAHRSIVPFDASVRQLHEYFNLLAPRPSDATHSIL